MGDALNGASFRNDDIQLFTEYEFMILNEKDFAAIDKALEQQMKHEKITETCPRCGNQLLYIQYGSSYEVRCATDGCISEVVRGI